MPRISKEELEKKYDIFVEDYLKHGNSAKAARAAGYAKSRASQTGHELLQVEYVKDKLSKYQEINKNINTNGNLSFEETLDLNRAQMSQQLAKAAKNGDPKALKQFLDTDYKYRRLNQEVMGDYEGLSTAEIVREANSLIEETQDLKDRVVETFGAEEM